MLLTRERAFASVKPVSSDCRRNEMNKRIGQAFLFFRWTFHDDLDVALYRFNQYEAKISQLFLAYPL
jgi:hypothetical protein